MVSTRRRPRLRVISHPLAGQPRHRIPYGDGLVRREVIEFFTESQWESLHPAERPPAEQTGHLPGVGYVALYGPSRNEWDEASEEYNDMLREHRLLKGIGV